MTRAIFIRHGQSTANIGQPTKNFAQVPLTDLGQEQALAVAASWEFTPGCIVSSPFLRAQQTSKPTVERFPEVPFETWPIYEFTFWDPTHWGGSEPKDLMHKVERYWHAADPDARFGAGVATEGSESFAMMLGRAEETFRRLESLRTESPVLLFTHGHFIQTLRLTVLYPGASAKQKMLAFRTFDEEHWVQNTEKVPATFDGTRWTMELQRGDSTWR